MGKMYNKAIFLGLIAAGSVMSMKRKMTAFGR